MVQESGATYRKAQLKQMAHAKDSTWHYLGVRVEQVIWFFTALPQPQQARGAF